MYANAGGSLARGLVVGMWSSANQCWTAEVLAPVPNEIHPIAWAEIAGLDMLEHLKREVA
jgi:hypothetical protein